MDDLNNYYSFTSLQSPGIINMDTGNDLLDTFRDSNFDKLLLGFEAISLDKIYSQQR